MLKQRTLFMLPMVCLLGLFFLSMSGVQAYGMGDESEKNSGTYNALQEQQDSPIDYKSRGKIYLDKGQFDDAISDFNKAIEVNPKDAGAYYYRGNAYYKKKEFDRAISDYSKAIEGGVKFIV